MSNTVTYHIVRSNDEVYINAIKTLASNDTLKDYPLLELGLYGGETFSCNVADLESNNDVLEILSAEGQVLESLKLPSPAGHAFLQIRRPPSEINKEQIFDTVTLSRGSDRNHLMNGMQFAKTFARFQQIIPPVSSSNLGPLLGPGVDKHFAAREEALNRLEQFVNKLSREMESTRKSREADILRREQELEAKHKKRQEELETEFSNRAATLELERESLNKLKSEIDDRSSTHVRREIRKELKQVLSQTDRLKYSPETGRRRLIIGAVYVVFLILFGSVAGILLFRELKSEDGFDYWQLARQAIFSIAFTVSASFFLRWLNNWAQQLADEELRQKQFEIDLDRASWIVEMALEWKAEKGEEIPEHLLARLSSNLFGRADTPDQSMTASDALASAILGTAAKAKVTVPGAEIELNRDGLRRLQKTVAKKAPKSKNMGLP